MILTHSLLRLGEWNRGGQRAGHCGQTSAPLSDYIISYGLTIVKNRKTLFRFISTGGYNGKSSDCRCL